MNRVTIYGADPAATARRFEDDGATLIHIVDLDGAIAGEPRNLDAIARIRVAVPCALDVSRGRRPIQTIRRDLAVRAGAVPVIFGAVLFPGVFWRARAAGARPAGALPS